MHGLRVLPLCTLRHDPMLLARLLQMPAGMGSEDAAHAGEAPYMQATGAPEGLPPVPIGSPDRERSERAAAYRRGRELGLHRRKDHAGPEHPASGGRGRSASVRDHADADEKVVSRAFAALADNVRDFAIFLMNREGIINYWGESARLIKWWSKAEAEGAHLRLLYPDGGSEDGTAEAHLQEAARRGEYVGEGQRMRSDGSTFWGGISLTALRDGSGELIGFAKVTRDLTGRRAAESALKGSHDEAEAARRRAEEANRSKGLFLATMSHEIRTPINAAMGYIDLLEMELAGPLSSRQREYLERIRFNNTHLLGIIDEILDFSRLDAGRLTLGRTAGLLEAPVRDALRMVELQAREKDIAISDSVSGFLTDIPYWGDESRVRQILVVLLSNAIKFTPANGRITVSAGTAERPPADVRLQGRGPWVYVRVEDTGPGIAEDRLAAIFQPFEQADMTHTRQYGGAGLGLAIAQRLAQAMDGDLAVRSQPELGSSFFLWLPAAAEEAVKSPRSRTERMGSHRPELLTEVRDAILAELERIVYAFVARLRSEPVARNARTMSEAELEDHLATFLSDLADTFNNVNLASGPETAAFRDGTAIQRTIADRHGRQRRRLGWSEAELRREFEILAEEVAAAVQRRIGAANSEPERDGAVDAATAFITSAERISLEAFRSSTSSD